jgi:alpha-beta hydrolase superfamily lysophospholipase
VVFSRRAVGRTLLAPLLAVLTAVGLLAGCGGSAKAASTPPPAGLPNFYSVPDPLPSGPAGKLIKSEPVAVSGLDASVYRVMYLSESVQNRPVPVTGLVMVPTSPPPPGGYPVVSWGHGTNGMADQCAPSLSPTSAVPLANQLLDKGWEVTASDYQGEGTPGLLPYIVGVSAARNTIDIVRAARQLGAAHASPSYVVWGHSEGGQTAMFALDVARSYAPGLRLQGVVAGAPPSQFNLIYQFLLNSPFRYYVFMVAAGFNAGYGNTAAPLSEVLTPKALSLLPVLEQGCSDYVASQLDKYSLPELSKGDPFSVPAWQKLLHANDPQSFTTPSPIPLLMIQGGSDEQIPTVSTQILASHLCGLGQDLERWIYPGQNHAGVVPVSMQDMVHWISDRFAGQANPDPYAPTGQPGIQDTRCPS